MFLKRGNQFIASSFQNRLLNRSSCMAFCNFHFQFVRKNIRVKWNIRSIIRISESLLGLPNNNYENIGGGVTSPHTLTRMYVVGER